MSKKLIALFCAALILASWPTAALGLNWDGSFHFLGNNVVGDNDVAPYANETYDGATISNLTVTSYNGATSEHSFKDSDGVRIWRASGIVKGATTPKTYPIAAYKILHTVAFSIEFSYGNTDDGIPQYDPVNEIPVNKAHCERSVTFGIQFDPKTISDLCKEYDVAESDLRLMAYEVYLLNNKIKVLISDAAAEPLPVSSPRNITIGPDVAASGTVVLAVVDPNAQPPKPDPVKPEPKPNTPVVNKKPSSSSSDSGSDSVAWRDLQVTGSPEVSAQGYLNGSNASDADSAYLVVKRLTSGSAFNELRAAAGGDNLNKAFDVTLFADGKEIHNDFGRLRISFDVGTQYSGRKATVWHLHNDGALTHEDTWVIDGEVTIEVTDLSEFGIDIEGVTTAEPQVDDDTRSPKTGQSIPAGTAAAAVLVAATLGTTAVAVNRRRIR